MMNKSMNFLHIFDDEKFVDLSEELFLADEANTHYVIVLRRVGKRLKYVKSKKSINIEIDDNYIRKINALILDYKIDILGIHGLNEYKENIIVNLRKKLVIIWFIFGFDLYQRWKPIEKLIYDNKTRAFVNKGKSKGKRFIEIIITNPLIYKSFANIDYRFFNKYKSYRLVRFLKELHPHNYLRAIKYIDYAAPVLKSEMEFIHKINRDIRYLPFSYGSVEQHFMGSSMDQYGYSDNILIGNSATASNNHLDAFQLLFDLGIKNRTIVVPLSYGSKKYRKEIMKCGSKIFGERFKPLVDFLSLEDYNVILKGCSYAIFNHIRQQAVGNIIIMLALGAKIFMNKKSPVYSQFKNDGFILFTMEELNQKSVSSTLTMNEKLINRQLLQQYYSKEQVEQKLKELGTIISRQTD